MNSEMYPACGDCRTEEQKSRMDVWMAYILDNGMLYVFGNDWLLGVEEHYNENDQETSAVQNKQRIVSQFKGMEFNTAVVWPGVKGLGEGCFNECKALEVLVIHDQGLLIHTHCAEHSSLRTMHQQKLPDVPSPDSIRGIKGFEIEIDK